MQQQFDFAFMSIQPATELIREIAVLELEVVHLEQYLLSLYRKAFDQQLSSVSPSMKNERSKSPLCTPRGRFTEIARSGIISKMENLTSVSGFQSLENPRNESRGVESEEKLLDSAVHRCHSALSQHSAFSARTSPPEDSLAKILRPCHSQPLSMMEVRNTSTIGKIFASFG